MADRLLCSRSPEHPRKKLGESQQLVSRSHRSVGHDSLHVLDIYGLSRKQSGNNLVTLREYVVAFCANLPNLSHQVGVFWRNQRCAATVFPPFFLSAFVGVA